MRTEAAVLKHRLFVGFAATRMVGLLNPLKTTYRNRCAQNSAFRQAIFWGCRHRSNQDVRYCKKLLKLPLKRRVLSRWRHGSRARRSNFYCVLSVLPQSLLRQIISRSATPTARFGGDRSEERRVGKECRSRWSPY